MNEHPVSPEAAEAQAELAQEAAWRKASNDNALAAQRAEIRRVNAAGTLRNAAAWFITMAWIVGTAVVVSQVIL